MHSQDVCFPTDLGMDGDGEDECIVMLVAVEKRLLPCVLNHSGVHIARLGKVLVNILCHNRVRKKVYLHN